MHSGSIQTNGLSQIQQTPVIGLEQVGRKRPNEEASTNGRRPAMHHQAGMFQGMMALLIVNLMVPIGIVLHSDKLQAWSKAIFVCAEHVSKDLYLPSFVASFPIGMAHGLAIPAIPKLSHTHDTLSPSEHATVKEHLSVNARLAQVSGKAVGKMIDESKQAAAQVALVAEEVANAAEETVESTASTLLAAADKAMKAMPHHTAVPTSGGAAPLLPVSLSAFGETQQEGYTAPSWLPWTGKAWPGADAARSLWDWAQRSTPSAKESRHTNRQMQDVTQNTYPGEILVMSEEFNQGPLDTSMWKPEISGCGYGNSEFELYTQNASNRMIRDGILHILPGLTSDVISAGAVAGVPPFSMDLWGTDPPSQCTAGQWGGCMRTSGAGGSIINPITSARLRTAESFAFRYGRVEVRARMPKGDWLWPAIWLLPRHQAYGPWPASGEIDIVESRGNAPSYPPGGRDVVMSTLHWGPSWDMNRYEVTSAKRTFSGPGDLSDEFHTYGLVWGPDRLTTYLDTPSNPILDVQFSEPGGMWQKGGLLSSKRDNPWAGSGTQNAPFDEHFYIIINLAVGGGFFPDGVGNRPWGSSATSAAQFWAARDSILPTWGWVQSPGGSGGAGWVPGPEAHRSALSIDWIRVWQPEGSHAPQSVPGRGSSMSDADRGNNAHALKRYASIWPSSWGLRAALLGQSEASRRLTADAGKYDTCLVTLNVTAHLSGECNDFQLEIV